MFAQIWIALFLSNQIESNANAKSIIENLYINLAYKISALKLETDIDLLIEQIGSYLIFAEKKLDPSDFRFIFLNNAKETLAIINKMDKNKKTKFFGLIDEYLIKISSNDKNVFEENFQRFLKIEEEISSIIGNGTFLQRTLIGARFFNSMKFNSNKDCEAEIKKELTVFEKKFGKNNPELAHLYLLLCNNYQNIKNWHSMISEAKRVKLLAYEKYSNLMAMEYLLADSYLIVGFNEIGKEAESIKIFESYNFEEIVENYNKKSAHTLFRIYSSIAKCYAKIGKINSALAYKESALALSMELFKNDKDKIKQEAIGLRDILFQAKEWKQIRSLESRFDLEPLPMEGVKDK